MVKLFNVVMGNVDSCPYAPRAKCGIGAELGSIISAGGSSIGNIFSNILGAKNQAAANRTNLQIARETNENQYRMFQEQNQFNLDMWNKQNEYNLPQAQVQRLLAAGINPSAVFGNGSVSEAGALTSAPAPSLQMAQVHPFMPNIDTSGAVNAFLQSQMNNEQRKLMAAQRNNVEANTAHTQTLNEYDQKSMFDRLRFLSEQAKKEGVLGDIARQQLRFETDSYWHRLKMLRQDVRANDLSYELSNEQIYSQRLQNGLAEVQLAYAPRMNEAQLQEYYSTVQQIKANIGLIIANRMLTDQQRLTEIENTTSRILDNKKNKLDYGIKKAIKKYVIQDAKNNSAMLDFERRNQKSGERLRRFASVVPFASGFTPKKFW